MDQGKFLPLLVCAGLLALAAPLRAGEAAWVTSDPAGTSAQPRSHTLQLPADWTSGAAVKGLGPRKIPHAFSLKPPSRAYTLDIAAENALDPASGSAEDYFAAARKLSGNPPAQRAQLPDYSMFEYFSSTAAGKGRAGCSVQGVLHKYVQRYYLTFTSSKGCPAGKDWAEALRVLSTLDPVDPGVSVWKTDFMRKLAGAGLGDQPQGSGNLRAIPATRTNGSYVDFDEIALFNCKNFLGNVYLFNEERTAHCWIAPLEDYKYILKHIDPRYLMENHPVFADCPVNMRQERACDPVKLRNFQPGGLP